MSDRGRPDVAILLGDPASVPLERIPAAIGELEQAKATLYARLAPPPPVEDRLLSIEEAVARTGMSRAWLYRHAAAGELPCARKVGRRLLFSSAGLARWLATRGRTGAP